MDSIREISGVLAGIDDADLLAGLLRALLTPHEQEAVSGRWELVKRLEQGMSQRAVAADLSMSLCKITRGSRELKRPDSALKRVIQGYLDPKR